MQGKIKKLHTRHADQAKAATAADKIAGMMNKEPEFEARPAEKRMALKESSHKKQHQARQQTRQQAQQHHIDEGHQPTHHQATETEALPAEETRPLPVREALDLAVEKKPFVHVSRTMLREEIRAEVERRGFANQLPEAVIATEQALA